MTETERTRGRCRARLYELFPRDRYPSLLWACAAARTVMAGVVNPDEWGRDVLTGLYQVLADTDRAWDDNSSSGDPNFDAACRTVVFTTARKIAAHLEGGGRL